MIEATKSPRQQPVRSRLLRWLLAGAGTTCVVIGAVGVILPGLPTSGAWGAGDTVLVFPGPSTVD